MELDSSFGLSISLTRREHSVDAHSTSYDVLVDGTHVKYRGPYGEGTRGMYETRTVEFDLTDDQLSELRREIDNYELRQSVTETFDVDTHGKECVEIEAAATIVIDGETHELQIAGVTDVRGQNTDMAHHQQARGLKTLCRMFKSWAEESEEKAWWNPF